MPWQAPENEPPKRPPGTVYHFLLPDDGMANYRDKAAKRLEAANFERIKAFSPIGKVAAGPRIAYTRRVRFTSPKGSPTMVVSTEKSAIVSAIQKCHSEMVKNGEPWTEWRQTPYRFTRKRADEFFVGVLFDRQQDADRAWDAGVHLVGNHFQDGDFWVTVSQTSIAKVKEVMSSGFGQTGAQGTNNSWWTGPYHRYHNNLSEYLKRNAEIILDQHDGDVRNIWRRVPSKNVDLIYERFLEFIGIGPALAKMAQFILVRDFGIAGGPESKRFMRVKPDVHVRRVAERLGLVSKGTPCVVTRELDALGLESQADVDLVLFRVGQRYCHRTPNCGACPLSGTCARRGVPDL